MKTVMFKMYTPNGNELSITKEGNTYSVNIDGYAFFSTPSYDKAREVLIA